MNAVRRVREIRERDSRVGLQQTLRHAHACELETARLESDLDRTSTFTTGSTAEFTISRAWLAGIALRLATAQEHARSARLVAEEARVHWQSDKTRQRAVERLLERRASARRAEVDRAEARQLDDIAGQGWIRRQAEGQS